MSDAGPPIKARRLMPAAGAALMLAAPYISCDSWDVSPCFVQSASAEPAGVEAPLAAPPAPAVTAGTLSTEPWTFAGQSGQIIRTQHYRIYTTEKNQILRERMSSVAEHALTHYRTAIVRLPAPPQRLDTYLMDTRPQWEAVTKLLMPEQSEQLTKIQRGGFASRGIGVYYDLGLYDTMAIAAHEGWHQYTQRTFKQPLPVWLEEGLATFMEGHRWVNSTPEFRSWTNIERFDQLRKAVEDDKLADLPALLESSPQSFLGSVDGSLLNYYAQVWALTHFLNEGENGKYRQALRDLLTDASEGNLGKVLSIRLSARSSQLALATRSGPAVFLAYFNPDVDAAGREFEQFVRQLVSAGSRDHIVAGRSPFAATSNRVPPTR